MLEEYEKMLDEITTLWATTRRGFRDGMIKVGRLIQAYLVVRMKEGDGLNSAERLAKGISRQKVVKHLARKLNSSNTRIQELIRAAIAVDLLCDGDPGNLSYASIRSLRILIYRPCKGLPIRRNKKRIDEDEVEPSELEKWEIHQGLGDRAKEMVQRAKDENWIEKDVRHAAERLLYQSASYKQNYVAERRVCSNQEEKDTTNQRLLKKMHTDTNSDGMHIALGKNPDDDTVIFDKLLSVLLASNDPDAILMSLKNKLEEVRSATPVRTMSDREARLQQYEEAAKQRQPLPFSQGA